MSSSYYLPNAMCIIIASHISNHNRIPYLMECLNSLRLQSVPIAIYLSISFETVELRRSFTQIMQTEQNQQNLKDFIHVFIREQKTPQMRHIQLVHSEMSPEHQWILFCDDDDTYDVKRVEKFAEKIAQYYNNHNNHNKNHNKHNPLLTGLYESTFGKNHREHRHEFWCYCVNRAILGRFLDSLQKYPDVLENKCCDVLFAEFLRRSNPETCEFIQIVDPLYNYRVDNNSDSVTGFIQMNQPKYRNITNPPPMDHESWADYVVNWDNYLNDNLNVYLHDTYLRTLVGVPFEDILNAEFKANRPLLEFVDKSHLIKIREQFDRVYKVCNEIYDIPL